MNTKPPCYCKDEDCCSADSYPKDGTNCVPVEAWPQSRTGEGLVREYTAMLDRIADQTADRAAIVRTRIADLEAELVMLDGLATQLGEDA